MTAEMVVANPNGVALAADSAVTIGSETGAKVYNTVNKIFRVCDEEPVGAMIHNAAMYSQAPWETLFKAYRNHYGHVRYPNLVNYADEFLAYIKNTDAIPDLSLHELVHEMRFAISVIANELDRWAQSHYAANPGAAIQDQQVSSKAVEFAEALLKQIRSFQLFDGISGKQHFPTAKSEQLKQRIREDARRTFGEGRVSKMLESLLADIAEEVARRGGPAGAESGVVVAGFGVDELFPVIASFDIRAPIDGKQRRRPMKVFEIVPGNDAVLIPYAQTDVVQTFMDGISPALAQHLEEQMEQTIHKVASVVFDVLADGRTSIDRESFEDRIQQSTKKIVDTLAANTRAWQEEHISGPVIDAVRHLPLDELASLAESMVKNTALRRRVSFELETVGGPVDVAVISKGDGLVWIERKHYFRSELNPHFFTRGRLISDD